MINKEQEQKKQTEESQREIQRIKEQLGMTESRLKDV